VRQPHAGGCVDGQGAKLQVGRAQGIGTAQLNMALPSTVLGMDQHRIENTGAARFVGLGMGRLAP
jgi:hypothetical protein